MRDRRRQERMREVEAVIVIVIWRVKIRNCGKVQKKCFQNRFCEGIQSAKRSEIKLERNFARDSWNGKSFVVNPCERLWGL